jgi:hypothetical protein
VPDGFHACLHGIIRSRDCRPVLTSWSDNKSLGDDFLGFCDANAVIVAVRKWLAQADDNFCERGTGSCSTLEDMYRTWR